MGRRYLLLMGMATRSRNAEWPNTMGCICSECLGCTAGDRESCSAWETTLRTYPRTLRPEAVVAVMHPGRSSSEQAPVPSVGVIFLNSTFIRWCCIDPLNPTDLQGTAFTLNRA
jgi:hypothetical protein